MDEQIDNIKCMQRGCGLKEQGWMLILLREKHTRNSLGEKDRTHIQFCLIIRATVGESGCPWKEKDALQDVFPSVSLMQEFVLLRLQLIRSPAQCLRTKQFRYKYKQQYATEISFEWAAGRKFSKYEAWWARTVLSITHCLIIPGLVGRGRVIPGMCWPDVVAKLRAMSSL